MNQWTCSNCGRTDNDGQFCISCGTERLETAPPLYRDHVASHEASQPNWAIFVFLCCCCTPITALIYAWLSFSSREPLPPVDQTTVLPKAVLIADAEKANIARKQALQAMSEQDYGKVILSAYEAIRQKLGATIPGYTIAEVAEEKYGAESTLAANLAGLEKFKEDILRYGKNPTEEMANIALELMNKVFDSF